MADIKTQTNKLEREYTIPLRREWIRVPQYERTGRAIKAIKKFLARHMKVPERNHDNIKIDKYLNNELWFRGRANPPAKIRVKAIKENDIVTVTFIENPKHVSFLKSKHEKYHKEGEKKEIKPEEKKEEKTEEQKTEEKEKGKAVAEERAKEIKQDAAAQKHVTKVDKAQHPQRMALQK